MGLPATRDQTFTPNSIVPSSVLNDIQDAIITLYNIIKAGTDEYLGADGFGPTGTWVPTGVAAISFDSGSVEWIMPIVAVEGRTITPAVELAQSVAVSGGTVQLVRVSGGTATFIGSATPIPSSTGVQVVTLPAHIQVAGNAYFLAIIFGAGAGTKQVHRAAVPWTR